jgi:hypothetical protein
VQHTQENNRGTILTALLVVALVFAANPAFAAGIADPSKPDPILTGEADGPCDPGLAQPELTPGTDVEGHQVASADIQTAPVPLQGQILVPLKSGQKGNPAYVTVDGKKLGPLLNPKPPCH